MKPILKIIGRNRPSRFLKLKNPGERIVLSRFAYLYGHKGRTCLKVPFSSAVVQVLDPDFFKFLFNLSQPFPYVKIPKKFRQAIRVLVRLEIVQFFGETSQDKKYEHWDFHDLVFHSESRFGTNSGNMGANYKGRDKFNMPPLFKPPMSQNVKILPGRSRKSPLDRLVDRRGSRRKAEGIITTEQLGRLLQKTCRVKEIVLSPVYHMSHRAYASGGGIYELEIYLTVRQCKGLQPGFYHYDPQHNTLEKLSGLNSKNHKMLRFASACWGENPPQILMTLAARYPRLAWKYDGMCYATVLKNVGSLLQTFYLAAVEEGVNICAFGSGNSVDFAHCTGIKDGSEIAVGELGLNG